MESHDAARIGRGVLQLERGVHSLREETLSTAEDDGIEKQMELVDEILLEEKVYELVAAVRNDGFAGSGFELSNLFGDVAADAS